MKALSAFIIQRRIARTGLIGLALIGLLWGFQNCAPVGSNEGQNTSASTDPCAAGSYIAPVLSTSTLAARSVKHGLTGDLSGNLAVGVNQPVVFSTLGSVSTDLNCSSSNRDVVNVQCRARGGNNFEVAVTPDNRNGKECKDSTKTSPDPNATPVATITVRVRNTCITQNKQPAAGALSFNVSVAPACYGEKPFVGSPVGGNISDEFGKQVAIDGDYAAILAPGYDKDLSNFQSTGAAFVYHRDASGWQIKNSGNPVIPATAGFNETINSVAISGTTLILGAAKHENASGMIEGALYVFSENSTTKNWDEITSIGGPEGSSQYNLAYGFASDLALYPVSATRLLIFVGARSWDGAITTDEGKVYVYEYNSATGQLTKQSVELTPALDDANFGASLAFSNGRLVVGAPGLGRAFVYTLTSNSPPAFSAPVTLQLPVNPTTGAAQAFGFDVDINNDWVIVGAPDADSGQGTAHVYKYTTGTWGHNQMLTATGQNERQNGAKFGSSVKILASNFSAIVGAPGADGAAGAAYQFKGSAPGNFSQFYKLMARLPNRSANSEGGGSLALSSGNILVMGASKTNNYRGAGYFIDLNTSF